ncbi:ATP-binding protein [Sphingomonas sp. IC4-52]|uniref:ATP-binding protein n=1 Tax=Sphingomonas sp. IC4-52 TaxID=2887202 RepID=UPI001D0F6130|nr:ATP-binding protein [Sphingomonas sp. IC4-52]MCC2978945.1 sensor histidine kinase [Sphingomonas sp. IC4-52]
MTLPKGYARDAALLALYAIGFVITHRIAAAWDGDGYYSLWFPAAGLRFALLWRAGARFTLPVALVELGMDVLTGAVLLTTSDWLMTVSAVVRPVFAYGLTVFAIRRLLRRMESRGVLFTAPMPFAVGSVLAPIAAALAAVPQALLRPDLTGVTDLRAVVLSLNAFAIGDLLGVLLVAPPLLWAADHVSGRNRFAIRRRKVRVLVEGAAVLAVGILLAVGLAWIGLGLQPAPVLVAIAWVGLRLGRFGAWCALLTVATIVLPFTAGEMTTAARLHLHLGLATLVVTGYLAGSFADAQVRAREDLARRDRLLFQAERLKTLRAMSVAVIHEISQPLSTLSIEARHLHESAADAPPEVAATAALIHAKATQLSELVRRLRRYGGRAVDEPTPLPVSALMDSVLALARPEVSAAGVTLSVSRGDEDLVVLGQEVELAQAMMNLIRNAAQACGPSGEVTLAAEQEGDLVRLSVQNTCLPGQPAQPGMGVGTLIARAIVEAHGGTLVRVTEQSGRVRATIALPLVGEPG